MNKEFDCVKMKHKAAEIINRKTSKLSIEEELNYWNKIAIELKHEHRGSKKKIRLKTIS